MKTLNVFFFLIVLLFLVACGNVETETETATTTDTELEATSTENSQELQDDLSVVVEQYLELKDALVASDLEAARTEAEELDVDMNSVNWQPIIDRDAAGATIKENLDAYLNSIEIAQDLDGMREAFSDLSNEMATLLREQDIDDELYWVYCPMAFDNAGAYWISDEEEINNPYFGEKMLRCGRIEEQL